MSTGMGTIMAMGTRMTTEATATEAVLRLAQWLSPGFPVGAFAWSHGLEAALVEGRVTRESVEDWLAGVLEDGAGRADAALLAAAHGAEGDALAEVDALARALAPSAERLAETVEQGTAFARTVTALWPEREVEAMAYPVAVGRAAGLHGLPLELTATMYLQAFIGNLVAVATRAVPLGQTEAQAILARLTERCEAVARAAIAGGLDRLGTASFAGDVAAMRHEALYSRVFRS
ncbi:urease accessory protein UreF [Vannielia litorea]|uniref:urease accessory protein UreF n=1 Tax=Vannielia litorea TaxID=1217970 RepID=UPI0021BD8C1E|nr:urease accessory UreF family protein [Vannielia litorea]